MAQQSMTGRTDSMTARTQSMTHQPSRTAQAARSLAAVDRIKNAEERAAAFARHMDQFPPLIARA